MTPFNICDRGAFRSEGFNIFGGLFTNSESLSVKGTVVLSCQFASLSMSSRLSSLKYIAVRVHLKELCFGEVARVFKTNEVAGNGNPINFLPVLWELGGLEVG